MVHPFQGRAVKGCGGGEDGGSGAANNRAAALSQFEEELDEEEESYLEEEELEPPMSIVVQLVRRRVVLLADNRDKATAGHDDLSGIADAVPPAHKWERAAWDGDARTDNADSYFACPFALRQYGTPMVLRLPRDATAADLRKELQRSASERDMLQKELDDEVMVMLQSQHQSCRIVFTSTVHIHPIGQGFPHLKSKN